MTGYDKMEKTEEDMTRCDKARKKKINKIIKVLLYLCALRVTG